MKTISFFLKPLLLFLALCCVSGSFVFGQGIVTKTFTLPYDTVLQKERFPDIPEYKFKEPKIALALSGGGAKGFAHIGVIKELEKNEIPIHAIYGTSIGAVVGGLYAIGYKPDDLIYNFKAVNLGSFFSIANNVRREYLYQDQKTSFSKSFLTLRFKNFMPLIPSFITSGQELTDQLNSFVLQGLHHTENFESLRIKFNAVNTDMVTGRSVAISQGNLSAAIRGSLTWPLLNPPVTMDDYKLVDGGILANIPASFPKKDGYDIVIAVNVTSGLRTMEDMTSPAAVVDRLLSIMQLEFDERELSIADIVITPNLQAYTATSFTDVDTMATLGEEAAAAQINAIKSLRDELQKYYDIENGIASHGDSFFVSDVQFKMLSYDTKEYVPIDDYTPLLTEVVISEDYFTIERKVINDKKIIADQTGRIVHDYEIIETLKLVKSIGYFKNAECDIVRDSSGNKLIYKVQTYPFIKAAHYSGNTVLPGEWLDSLFNSICNKPFNHDKWFKILETLNTRYRKQNLSLAKLFSVVFDSTDNTLYLQIREGVINKIHVIGNEDTRRFVILREFPLHSGNLFNIELATRGLSNIYSTDLFETVSLGVDYVNENPDIFIHVTEKPTQFIRFGLRIDDERYSQMYLDFRNDNFLQTGGSLGLITQTGFRDFNITLDYRMNKILNTPFFSKVQAKYEYENQYQYRDDETEKNSLWKSVRTAEFKELKYGGSFTLGTLYKKIGYLFAEYKLEYQEIIDLGDSIKTVAVARATNTGKTTISALKFGLVFDSQDQYPFPTKGSYFSLYYEFASSFLYTDVSFTKTFLSYEFYIPFGQHNVIRPKILFGFGDNALPYAEQFNLGGQNSFFGLRDNNYRGRQIFVGSMEYRLHLPIKLLFDTYLSIRYDLGSVWEETTAIKFTSLKHGVGGSIFLDTPIGPAGFSVGQVFKLTRDLPNNPISFGPFYTYLSLGFTLD